MAIKPFRDLLHKSFVNNVATRAWVVDLLRKNLGKLHFTGDVSQSADGHINFSGGGGAGSSCEFAFEVTAKANSSNGLDVYVSTGFVRTESGDQRMALINGTPLNATTPPYLTTGATGTRYVVMQIRYQPTFGNFSVGSYSISHLNGVALAQSPTIAIVTSSPSDTVPNINYENGTSNQGIRHVTLATINGATVTQGWWGNAYAIIEGSGLLTLNIGG